MRTVGYAVVAAAVALAAACGGGDGASGTGGVASAQDAAGRGSPFPTASISREDAQLEFARCMRRHGVQVQDPDPGGQGRVTVRLDGRPRPGTLEKAHEACRQYARAGGLPDPDDPQVQDRMREFARCMRAHGVPMQDPRPGGGVVLTEEDGVSDADREAAREACEPALGLGR
ncbi:hypothetical protein [Motilibacter aurantiacus]|uniref:hypothetical protein n=1 Tax=Motilibacter aurantiacus TaxID=2714955 RepID=UPI0014085E12|nr:hypothetical protein [Motilibacter aurantiacus]NHC43752.1 hypothetical protein [Motilibacter aurantiacus]